MSLFDRKKGTANPLHVESPDALSLSFDATWFDGTSSRAHAIRVDVSDGWLSIVDASGVALARHPLRHIHIDPPLGSAPRRIHLPENELIETRATRAVATLERHLRVNISSRCLYFFENHRGSIAALSLSALLVIVLFFTHALPFAARIAASRVPDEALDYLSDNALELLDRQFLQPSTLPAPHQELVRRIFTQVTGNSSNGQHYRLEIRSSKTLGANAFALPSGTIIVTDALVHLLNDDELAAVFAHEIAHIDQRHGVRLVLQNSGVFIVIGTLLGDINSLSGMAGTLPMVLIGSGYSREFEAEADLAAARYLLATRGTTAPMRSALARLLDNAANASMPYLSSHPETEERIEALLEFEKNHKPLSAGRTSDD